MMSNRNPPTRRQTIYDHRPYPAGEDGYDDDTPVEDTATRARLAGESLSRNTEETNDAYRLRVVEAKGDVLGVKRKSDDTTESYSHSVEEAMRSASERFARWRDRVSERARGAYDSARSGGQYAWESARSGAGQTYDAARATGDYAAGAVRGGYSASSRAVSYAGETVYDTFQRNPLLMGALGITLGGVIGLMLPATRREDEALGPTRDRVRDDLYDRAGDLADRASVVADEVVDSGRRAVDDLSEVGRRAADDLAQTGRRAAEELSETGRRAANEIASTGKRAADEQGLTPGSSSTSGGSTGSQSQSSRDYSAATSTTSNVGRGSGEGTFGGSATSTPPGQSANAAGTPTNPATGSNKPSTER